MEKVQILGFENNLAIYEMGLVQITGYHCFFNYFNELLKNNTSKEHNHKTYLLNQSYNKVYYNFRKVLNLT